MIEGFPDRLNEAIETSGLSKTQIATRCGCDRRTLYNAVSGNFMMSTENLARFCTVTKTDANWLLGISIERR